MLHVVRSTLHCGCALRTPADMLPERAVDRVHCRNQRAGGVAVDDDRVVRFHVGERWLRASHGVSEHDLSAERARSVQAALYAPPNMRWTTHRPLRKREFLS